MSCELCGTVEVYGKRKRTGKQVCIDCWKMKNKVDKKREKQDDSD